MSIGQWIPDRNYFLKIYTSIFLYIHFLILFSYHKIFSYAKTVCIFAPLWMWVQFGPVQLLSRVWLLEIPWTAACQASLSITNSWTLLKLMSMESVMPSNHLILCRPLLLPPSIFPSIWIFSNESVLRIRWPKYWNFNFSISPSNEYSGLISFRMDWDLLAVQGTLKNLLQDHGSKASILRYSAFLWSISHIHTWLLEKTIALTRWPLLAK